MSGTFQEREQSIEAKFAYDEELRFRIKARRDKRIKARRDKLFARWAAAELGLPEAKADALVKEVLAIKDVPDHERALKEHIGRHLTGRANGSEAALAAALDDCMKEARSQLGSSIV